MNDEFDKGSRSTNRRRNPARHFDVPMIDELEKIAAEDQMLLNQQEEEKLSLEMEIRGREEQLMRLETKLMELTAACVDTRKDTTLRKKEKTRRDKIEKQIDRIYKEFFAELEDWSMKIMITFGNQSAEFNISEEECGRFKDLKEIVAPFFNLNAENIFFCDKKGMIIEENLRIKPTLFPLNNSRLKDYIPHLTIVLKSYKTMSQYIKSRVPKYIETSPNIIEDTSSEMLTQKYIANRSSEPKKLVETKKNWCNFLCIGYIRRLFHSLLFLAIVILWTINVFNDNRYFDSNLMSSGLYSLLNNEMNSPGALNSSDKLIFLDYIRIIKQPYAAQDCYYINPLYQAAYSRTGKTCYQPDKIDKTDFSITVNGKTEVYQYQSERGLGLNTIFGTAPIEGFQLDYNYFQPLSNQSERLEKWNAHFKTVRFESYVINVYNPSTQLLAQVYLFNKTMNSENIQSSMRAESLNLMAPTDGQITIRVFLIVLASLALLVNFLGKFRFVPNKNASSDAEILLRQEYLRCKALGQLPPKMPYAYWHLDLKYLHLILYRPTMDHLVITATMIAVITSVSLRTSLSNELTNLKIFDVAYFIDLDSYIARDYQLMVLNAVVTLFIMSALIKVIKVALQQILPEATYFEEMQKRLIFNLFSVILILAYILCVAAMANQTEFGLEEAEYNSFLSAFLNSLRIALRGERTHYKQTTQVGTSDPNTSNKAAEFFHPVLMILVIVYLIYNLIIVQAWKQIESERTHVVETTSFLQKLTAKGIKAFQFKKKAAVPKSPTENVNVTNRSILTEANPLKSATTPKSGGTPKRITLNA